MREGWSGDDYVVLFAESDVPIVSQQYGIAAMLPGYRIVGLRGWDDFIIQDQNGGIFTVPTVPCDLKHLKPFHLPDEDLLIADNRFVGKVKWYVKPIKFGGDPTAQENITLATRRGRSMVERYLSRPET